MNDPSLQVRERRLWLAMVARGFVGILVGLLLMSNPWISLKAIAGLIVAYMLADAALSLYAATRAGRAGGSGLLLVLVGVIDAVAALVVLMMPAILPMRLAVGLRSIAAGVSNALWTRGKHWSELVTMGGVASVALGILILAWPGPATVALPWLLGLEAMVSGSLFFAGAASEIRSVPVVAPQRT
jgi:uncharacterized membrane protein HdeD (DUF308 family)